MRIRFLLLGLLFAPTSVLAAPPTSLWLDEVLARVDAGIAFAATRPASNCADATVKQELENNLSAVRAARSAVSGMTEGTDFLVKRTLCAEGERYRISEKLNAIYAAMNTAVTACKPESSVILRETYSFLVEAYNSFLKGSVDPTFIDDRLRYTYKFHDVALWNSGEDVMPIEKSTASLCPYSTDYAPHFIGYVPAEDDTPPALKSYGCDLTVLQTMPVAFQTEVSDFMDFLTQTDSLAGKLSTLMSQTIFNIDSVIALLTGADPPTPPPALVVPPPHETINGCLRPPSPLAGGEIDIQALDALLATYPDYFDPKNIVMRDVNGTMVPTYSPLPEETLPVGALFQSLTDPFSIRENTDDLLTAFDARKAAIGANRPLEENFAVAGEQNAFTLFGGGSAKSELSFISSNIERETGFFDVIGRDAYERNLEAAKPLHEAVNSLVDVTENFLPKQYIPNVVYFLLRSCVDGHCQSTLDTVAKRIFNEYCHPYVSGNYKDPDALDKCFCAAGYEGESYCAGGVLSTASQPEAPLQCGEQEVSPFEEK